MMWTILSIYAVGAAGMVDHKDDNDIGIGGGVGIEYNWQDFVEADVPPIYWNLELGLTMGGYSGMYVGGGFTYFLDN